VARAVGSAILSEHPELKVNLTAPDWEIHVEVRGATAYLFSEVLPGVGGLPLGTQGKLVGLVENAEGAMASWLMMKRGSYVLPVFRTGEESARHLRAWDPGLRLRSIDALEDMRAVAEDTGALGFVYPWTAPGGPDEDYRPAFYPLMGLDSGRLETLRATVMAPGSPTSPSPGANE
jgi:thiamine biosynthesis protein ThiI